MQDIKRDAGLGETVLRKMLRDAKEQEARTEAGRDWSPSTIPDWKRSRGG